MSPRKMSLNRIVFLIAIFFVLAFGLYVLTNWGFAYGWIGIILVISGLGVFTIFFSRVMTKNPEQ